MNKLIILSLVITVLSGVDAFNRIRIEDINVIDLYRGQMTVGFKPVAQQACVSINNRIKQIIF